jgi:hypothetical protein
VKVAANSASRTAAGGASSRRQANASRDGGASETGTNASPGRRYSSASPAGTTLTPRPNAGPAEVARAWRPEVFERLREIKRAVDPGDVFRFGHGIGVG